MIKKLLSNAMLSLIMDKQAKQKLQSIRGNGNAVEATDNGEIPQKPGPVGDGQPTPDRQELIAQAMAIHQTKTAILDDLTLNEKSRLQELAAKALLGNKGGDGRE